jgi:hypothetical protein
MKQDKVFKVLAVLLISLIALLVVLHTSESSILSSSNIKGIQVSPATLQWQKTVGGTSDDRALYCLPLQNGSFLVAGSSRSFVEGATVGWAILFDSSGNIIWNRTVRADYGTELRYALSTQDGFLLVGNTFTAQGDVNGFVDRTDNAGNIIWNITVGTPNIDKLFSAAKTSDGYALFGLTQSSDGKSAAWVVKIDFNGNMLWNKTYPQGSDSVFRTCVSTPDGGFMAAGYAHVNEEQGYDFLLTKINAQGNVEWNYTYGTINDEKASSMTQATDGYLIVGDQDTATSSTDAWVIKVDYSGNLVWQKTVGGKDADSPAYVTTAKNDGYLVAGFTFSWGNGYRDFWLFKIDDSSNVEWSCTYGTEIYQEAYGVFEQNPDNYVMVGWTDPFGHPELVGQKTYDIYVIDLSVSSVNQGLTSLQWVEYVLAGIILVVAFLLLFNLYYGRRIKQQ